MIHTNLPRNCVVFLLLCKLTRSAIYGSQKFDSHKWPTVLVDEVIRKTEQFWDMFVWIIVFYFYNIFLPTPDAFYNKPLQMPFKDQLDRSKATCSFQAIGPFRYRKKKNHRYTNNLQGLQKVVVKDFSWNIMPWNALLFEKTVSILDNENYWFILNTCHDRAKHADTRVGFPIIFSQLRWPVEPKFSQVCYLI
jgi:hypothetical protein